MAGYVYLIGSSKHNWYKIGKTSKVGIRIRDIGILLPFRIEVVAVWMSNDYHNLERKLHERLDKNRINGEWFRLTEDEIEAIVFDMKYISVSTLPKIEFENLQDTERHREIPPVARDEEKLTRTKEWREFAKERKGLPREETNKWKAELLAHQRCRVKHLMFLEKIHLTYWRKQLYG